MKKSDVQSVDTTLDLYNAINKPNFTSDNHFASGIILKLTDLSGNVIGRSLLNGEDIDELKVVLNKLLKNRLKEGRVVIQSRLNRIDGVLEEKKCIKQ